MALTRTQIISEALTLLGKAPIMNLTNQSDIATAANQAFDMLLYDAVSKGSWRFCGKIVELNLLPDPPLGGYWMYAYQLPADYVAMWHLWPSTDDFEIYNNSQIYSNFNSSSTPLYIDYFFVPAVNQLPPYFIKYFIYEIASHLALSNAQRPDYADYLDKKTTILFGQAQAADAKNRPQNPLKSAPMLSRRYVSTYASG